jgi:DNA-binding transcriptional LysR family regulator
MLATRYAKVNSLAMFAWDDIRVFLALYRERTTGRAAADLGTSQPTVTRRLAAIEESIGLTLFERHSGGLTPTKAADRLYAAAMRVERGICEFTAEVDSLTESGLKLVRVTLLDHFEQLMVPVLRSFRERWPAVHVDLLPSDRVYDLDRSEADIAVRGRIGSNSDELVTRALPPCGFSIYASAQSPPGERPASIEQVAGHPLALLDGAPAQLPIYAWLASLVEPGVTPPRCSGFRALASTIASGAAICALPCTMGDSHPMLVRCFDPPERFDVPIYLIARRTILRRPPARDLFEAIFSYFVERPSLLTGRQSNAA